MGLKEERKKPTYLTTTNDAFVLIIAKRAFVADAHEGCGAHVAVANWTFTVAFIAQAPDCYSGLFAAHY